MSRGKVMFQSEVRFWDINAVRGVFMMVEII